MRRCIHLLVTLVLLGGCALDPATDIELSALFSDHMVLQRDQDLKVWGTAAPGGQVTVALAGRQVATTVDDDGRWQAVLPPMPAGGPHTLTVAGADTISVEDVLIGEVWLAAGASNMQWSVENAADAEDEIAAGFPRIRLFTVQPTVAAAPFDAVTSAGWQVASPQTTPSFSAVAYFFGRKLHRELDVPIGLISTSWGSSYAEAWTSSDGLLDFPAFQQPLQELHTIAEDTTLGAEADRLTEFWRRRLRSADAGYRGTPNWSDAAFTPQQWPSISLPANLEAVGLQDFDGIVWYWRTIDIPSDWSDDDLVLSLGYVDDQDSTWVNGVRVGATSQWNRERTYTVPASVVRPGRNVITVRMVDTGGSGGFWGDPSRLSLTHPGGASQSLAGPWFYNVGFDLRRLAVPGRLANVQHYPSVLFNGMVAPLRPYAIRGVIWYQGESNVRRASQYRTLFPALIRDWHRQWEGDFPFYFVQLPNVWRPQTDPNEASAWAELREAQRMALEVPQTGMAVTIDIGGADRLHPSNKQDAGRRLARLALAHTYDRDLVPSGPLYRAMHKADGGIRLTFEYAEGLTTPDGAPLSGFAIAGADRRFVWADAQIDGATVVVSSAEVPDPVAVRYGWGNNPPVNLYNAAGLPVSPFRTDDWPGVTQDAGEE